MKQLGGLFCVEVLRLQHAQNLHLVFIFTAFFLMNSISLAGVETQISLGRLFRFCQSELESNPPNRASTFRANTFDSLRHTEYIYWHSSLVGDKIRAIGLEYSILPSSFYSIACTFSGNKKASVFPEPVFAIDIMSRPCRAQGQA